MHASSLEENVKNQFLDPLWYAVFVRCFTVHQLQDSAITLCGRFLL
jgi:hypothetical protein